MTQSAGIQRHSDARAVTGYGHRAYAASLAEFGAPRHLQHCDGWILERAIPGTTDRDAMGCYPLFVCRDWTRLAADLDEIGTDLVSLTLVTDPFGDYEGADLKACFERVVHFKDHYVADLRLPRDKIVKRSHRATVRRALRKVEVRMCPEPLQFLEKWIELFAVLAKKHAIHGLRAFSRVAFAKQLRVPGMVMFEASAQGTTVGLDLWYIQGDVAYGHLVAFSELGYELRASYATKWNVLAYFSDKVRWIDFGAGAGFKNQSDGLTTFKQGWSTETRPVYLCGRVFRPRLYDQLTSACGLSETEYFPAYRHGEFT